MYNVYWDMLYVTFYHKLKQDMVKKKKKKNL